MLRLVLRMLIRPLLASGSTSPKLKMLTLLSPSPFVSLGAIFENSARAISIFLAAEMTLEVRAYFNTDLLGLNY